MFRLEEVKDLVESRTDMGIPAEAELGIVMKPILKELKNLKPENKDHTAARQLFKWLVDPGRTGNEFLYVIGPLKERVWRNSDTPSEYYYCYLNNIGYIAAEAMAVRSPVLEGSWELVAWLLVNEATSFSKAEFGAGSEHLSTWIILVIRDHILCPNPYLRIEMIILLRNMIELNDHNRKQALESVLSACSSLTMDYLMDAQHLVDMDHCAACDMMELSNITDTLEMILSDKNLLGFGEKLSAKLGNVKSSRLSALIQDGNYYRLAVDPIRYTFPIALYGLTALLKAIGGLAQMNLNCLQESGEEFYEDDDCRMATVIEHTINALLVIIRQFKMVCQDSLLVEQTASTIMNVLELVILYNAGEYYKTGSYFPDVLLKIDLVLKELITKNSYHLTKKMPICFELTKKYKERLKCLKYIWIFNRCIELPNLNWLYCYST